MCDHPQLFSSEDETLLVWWYTFFVLDLCLDVFNGVRWLDLKSNCFSSKCFNKNLHSSSKAEYEMKSTFLLDVIIRQGTPIFELLTSKNETLLVWGNSFLILNFGLDIFNGIRWFDLKGDSFSSQCLDKDLHSSSETEHKMKSRFLLDVIVRKSTSIFQLLASKRSNVVDLEEFLPYLGFWP